MSKIVIEACIYISMCGELLEALFIYDLITPHNGPLGSIIIPFSSHVRDEEMKSHKLGNLPKATELLSAGVQ